MNAKSDCERLLNEAMAFAEEMLTKNGEFFPFARAIADDDELVSVLSYDGREQPPSSDVIRLTKAGLIKGARELRYKATALASDVKITRGDKGGRTDAVSVSLNHRDDYSVIVVIPYSFAGSKILFETPFSLAGEADIFFNLSL